MKCSVCKQRKKNHQQYSIIILSGKVSTEKNASMYATLIVSTGLNNSETFVTGEPIMFTPNNIHDMT